MTKPVTRVPLRRNSRSGWVGRRAVRLLLPTALYSGLVLLAVGVCSRVGVDPGTLALVGWDMAMQFWFLPVYLLLSALTPVLHAAHRRWGLAVPVAMGAVALSADTVLPAALTAGGGGCGAGTAPPAA